MDFCVLCPRMPSRALPLVPLSSPSFPNHRKSSSYHHLPNVIRRNQDLQLLSSSEILEVLRRTFTHRNSLCWVRLLPVTAPPPKFESQCEKTCFLCISPNSSSPATTTTATGFRQFILILPRISPLTSSTTKSNTSPSTSVHIIQDAYLFSEHARPPLLHHCHDATHCSGREPRVVPV